MISFGFWFILDLEVSFWGFLFLILSGYWLILGLEVSIALKKVILGWFFLVDFIWVLVNFGLGG